MARTIFDIGMFDGEDTAYYLDCGFHVVAVEANPAAVAAARSRFADAVGERRLVLEEVAIGPEVGTTELYLCSDDPGSSSLSVERVRPREHAGNVVTVATLPLLSLFERHGIPFYMKVDIEGADRYCILELTTEMRPSYVSFEMGHDAEELVKHLAEIGYADFKIISQVSFRELARLVTFGDRLARRVRHTLGLPAPDTVRRAGRQFRREHSSGPLPELADGRWYSADATLDRWRRHQNENPTAGGWFDLHARASNR